MKALMNVRRLGAVILFGSVAALGPFAMAETVVTESAGTISSFGPDALVIRSNVASAPTRYVVAPDVTYVDDAGMPVPMEVIRSGVPVTVRYVRDADRIVARRVIVHRRPVVEERVVTPAPRVVEEERVVRPAPPVVEERVVRPAPPVVEERVVRPAAPLVEERRTTTTTTTITK
jgi:hypothetical protein